jgi:Zn-dependent protease with chaperone function
LANQAALSLLLVNWVVAFAYFAPTALSGRRFIYRRPSFGIALWLTLFATSVLAFASALLVACYSVFTTWTNLQQTRVGSDLWLEALVVSFAPWLVLAFAGIATALVNQKLDGIFDHSLRVAPTLMGAKRVGEVSGYAVMELPLDFVYIGSTATERVIVQTRGVRELLSPEELQACQQHEVAHLRLRHGRISAFVSLASQLLGGFAVTRAMNSELSLLLELVADSKVEDKPALKLALQKFVDGDREVGVRLAVLGK